MTSLPSLVPVAHQNSTRVVNAYNECLGLEKTLQERVEKGEDVENDLVYIRILGYLIHFAPGTRGLETVVQEINSCDGDHSALISVGQMYYDHLLRSFRAYTKKARERCECFKYASPPSFMTLEGMLEESLAPAPLSHATAQKKGLVRDGYRCVLSGDYDSYSYDRIPELRERISRDPGDLYVAPTECTHTFSQSSNIDDIERPPAKNNHTASIWEILRRFGYESIADELKGPNAMHRLDNMITMTPNLRVTFDDQGIWLVATDKKNEYKVETSRPIMPRGCAEIISFTTPDPVKLPVPSPTYLAIHAACAKVSHLSGAGHCIDTFYWSMEEATTLDPGGASASMLEEALRGLQVVTPLAAIPVCRQNSIS